MAWTTPPTFTSGNILTAAQMNTNVRDNTNFLFSPPAVRVEKTSDTSIPNATLTALGFATEIYDTDNMHDNVTNNSRITIVTPGLYCFHGGVKWTGNATGRRLMAFEKNGSLSNDYANDHRDAIVVTLQSSNNLGFTALFAAADYMEAYVYQDSGAGLAVVGSVQGGAWISAEWAGRGT